MQTALDLRSIRDHLGVAKRVSEIPPAATVRGVWFSMASDYVRKLGRTETLAFRSAVTQKRRLPFLSYSLREYVEELATAAAIVHPQDPTEGIRRIWRQATAAYVATPFGRSLLRLLRVSPLQYMRWLVDHRDHFCNYGRWRLVQHGESYVTMEMEREYIWLEHAHRAGAESVLEIFNLNGTVEPELTNAYEGRLHIRWQPRPG